ncbi:MAG TPA: hypothetical protein VID19_05400 [Candidatus Eremiobacteraceae bacterium]|jgi:hypothetical protein
MLQLIGLLAALIANQLLAPMSSHTGGPAGVSGGGPVGRPVPHATPVIPNPPHAQH